MQDINLHLLLRETEAMLHCPPGSLVSQDRSQPLVSFRKLATLIARQAGFGVMQIAEVFERDHRTVTWNADAAAVALRKYPWWGHAKSELLDRWQAAVDEMVKRG